MRLLQYDLLPLIPSEGSVGASGDLTPLSYLAAVLCGEGEVWRNGVHVSAAHALADAGIAPLRVEAKRRAGDHEWDVGHDRFGVPCLCARRLPHAAGYSHHRIGVRLRLTAMRTISMLRCSQ